MTSEHRPKPLRSDDQRSADGVAGLADLAERVGRSPDAAADYIRRLEAVTDAAWEVDDAMATLLVAGELSPREAAAVLRLRRALSTLPLSSYTTAGNRHAKGSDDVRPAARTLTISMPPEGKPQTGSASEIATPDAALGWYHRGFVDQLSGALTWQREAEFGFSTSTWYRLGKQAALEVIRHSE